MSDDFYGPEDLPPCDGGGQLHFCKGDTRSMQGPHVWCEYPPCPGCENCEPDGDDTDG